LSWDENISFYTHSTVCSIVELRGFGERSPSATEGAFIGFQDNHPKDLKEFKTKLRELVENWDEYYNKRYKKDAWDNKSMHRLAFIVAYTSSLQPVANENLAALGFETSGLTPKLKHPDSDLAIWWITPDKFLEAIKE